MFSQLRLFYEGKVVICYCPELDLSGYGFDEEEAIESFLQVFREFKSKR